MVIELKDGKFIEKQIVTTEIEYSLENLLILKEALEKDRQEIQNQLDDCIEKINAIKSYDKTK